MASHLMESLRDSRLSQILIMPLMIFLHRCGVVTLMIIASNSTTIIFQMLKLEVPTSFKLPSEKLVPALHSKFDFSVKIIVIEPKVG